MLHQPIQWLRGIFLALTIAAATGCYGPPGCYGPDGYGAHSRTVASWQFPGPRHTFENGYREEWLAYNLLVVFYVEVPDQKRAREYALLRAADLTLERKFERFVLLRSDPSGTETSTLRDEDDVAARGLLPGYTFDDLPDFETTSRIWIRIVVRGRTDGRLASQRITEHVHDTRAAAPSWPTLSRCATTGPPRTPRRPCS
jgi:hypothetical protein